MLRLSITIVLVALVCVSSGNILPYFCQSITAKYDACLSAGFESGIGCTSEATTSSLTPAQSSSCKKYEMKLQKSCEYACSESVKVEVRVRKACPAGYYKALMKCKVCPEGTYSEAGASFCTQCSTAQGTSGAGAGSEAECSYTHGGCVEEKVNYWGADISDAGSSGIDECVDRCLSTAACVSVSLRDSDNHCWLKSRVYGEEYQKQGGVSSVPMKCIYRSVENCVNTDTNFPGRDISNAPSSGIAACTERCGNTANCVAVSVSSTAHCWLKDRVSGGGVEQAAGTSSVNMRCLEGSVRNCMNYRTNFVGADISHAGSTGDEECVERCRETEGCVAVTLGSDNLCWLKNKANGQTVATGDDARSLNMACLDVA